jgi:hypothetical protein
MPLESFRSVYIEMYYFPDGVIPMDDDEAMEAHKLSNGTGFFFDTGKFTFLVTARHNLSARHWETNELISSRGVEPTHLRMRFRERPKDSQFRQQQIQMDEYLFPLIDDDGIPNWIEHPDYRRRMDVAALAFEAPETNQIECWTPETSGSDVNSGVWVAQDVFAVGYPFGQVGALDLPLWIRGTVASEPALHYLYKGDPLPVILIDARTRTGQSGSPTVILNRRFVEDTHQHTATPRSKLVGIYTGRLSDEADLGFVWRIEDVQKMFDEGVRGSFD